MARPFPTSRLVAWAALAVLVVAWFLPRPVPARGSDADVTRRALAGATIDGAVVPGFALAIDSATTQQTGNPATAVCCTSAGYIPGLWGTYIGGDAFVGTVKSPPLPVNASYWYLPVLGYPSRPGNHLYVEVTARDGASIQRSTFHGLNPGEALALWRIDLRRFAGGSARIYLEDGTADATGWLGVGAPIASERPAATVEDLTRGPTNYVRYWLSGLVLLALVFIPGLALQRWRSHRFASALGDRAPPNSKTVGDWALPDSQAMGDCAPLSLEPLLLPIPGLMVLAVYGLLLWLFNAGSNGLARHILLVIEAGLAGWSATSGRAGSDRETAPPKVKKIPVRGRTESALGTTRSTSEYSPYWIWGIYLAAVILAAGYCILRRPVTQEEYRGSSFQSRMVASPPDHLIPYSTAIYLHAGYDGVAHSAAYFGPGSVATRGPLAPLIINAAFNVLRIRPMDPPDATADAWPAAADGFYAARWIGFLTNACAIAGVAALTLALGGRVWFAAIWAAVAPVTFVNVAFAWPKLFAAYFILLALAECLRGKPAYRWGLWIALAYWAHPIGGLFAVPLLIYAARTRGWKPAAQCAAVTGLCLLPWLTFQHTLPAADSFVHYPLGDGRGTLAALSALTWLKARWLNLWYTVVPGAFTLSPVMRAWTWGPLSEPARWAIQYAKTLPGNLGYYGCALAYFGLIRLGWAKGRSQTNPAALRFAQWFLLPCLLTLLVYWGYSSDGLGRDCLEPLSLAVLAWTAAATSLAARPSALMLGFVTIETMTMVVFGFL